MPTRSGSARERRCREDVGFRVVTANQIPDHATIVRFRARHEQALADTFVQVLALCAKAGLAVGVVALDGSLLADDASPGATRSYAPACTEDAACNSLGGVGLNGFCVQTHTGAIRLEKPVEGLAVDCPAGLTWQASPSST